MANRAAILTATIAASVALAACGRATDQQINQALGITPTPTPSAEQLAEATAAASATAAAAAAALASPGSGAVAALGDVVSGKRQFATWCTACHGPGGNGPELLVAGGPGASVTAASLLPLVREAAGHPSPPGPYKVTEISDKQVQDLAAYIRERAAGQ